MVRLGSLLSNKSTFSTVLRQRGSPARFVGVLSVTLALAAIVIAGGLGFSSQKPQTVAPRASSFQSQSETAAVEFIWCGAVTANSARVNARVSPDGSRVRLAISGSADMTAPQFGSLDTALAGINDRVVSLSVNGLTPDTPYHYALEINGILSLDKVGRFQTYPENNASFTFAFASCAWTGSSHQVFDEIRAQDPLFFFHLGDMHYQNISVNDR
ncbi:MAG: hypothetical protein ACE5GA_10175, partial [Candidatus Zixiibacteriota bacterium]